MNKSWGSQPQNGGSLSNAASASIPVSSLSLPLFYARNSSSNDSDYDYVLLTNWNSSFDVNFTDKIGNESAPIPPDFTEISELNKDCIIVYTVLFFVAAISNLLVLSCVSRHDRLGKSRTPLLIMNLCMADLIVTFFLMPTEIFWRYTIAWKGGDLLCRLSQFVRAFGLYLSSNVVICISVDRYFAIVYPLKLAGAAKRVKWMLVGAWIVSGVFAGPQMFIYHVASHPVYPEFRQCVTEAFLKTGPYNELIYNVSSVAALYFIPLVVIIFTYTMILWKIHKKSRENAVANRQQELDDKIERNHFNQLHLQASQLTNSSYTSASSSVTSSPNRLSLPSSDVNLFNKPGTGLAAATIAHNFLHRAQSKRTRLMLRSTANQTATLTRARSRTLRLTLLILMTFIFCWTPYVVMTLWYMLDRGGASQVDERLQEALFIMAVTNSVLNPLIYGTVGRKQDCKRRINSLRNSSTFSNRFLHFCCCCCFFKRFCSDVEYGNSETVILSRMNRGSSVRRGSIYRNNSVRSQRSVNLDGLSMNNSASPMQSRRQFFTQKESHVISQNGKVGRNGKFGKILKGLVYAGSRYDERIERKCPEIIVRSENGRNKECVECGVQITVEYIVHGDSSASEKSTHV